MRSQTSYLVVMMCMMGCFAVVRLNPVGLILAPVNLGLAGVLLLAAAIVAIRVPWAIGAGMAAAALTTLVGVLGAAKVPGFAMPTSPLVWIVIGLYIAFRLTLIQKDGRGSEAASRPPPAADPSDRR